MVHIKELPPKTQAFVISITGTINGVLESWERWAAWIAFFDGFSEEIAAEMLPIMFGARCGNDLL